MSSNYSIGHEAENVASEYLKNLGYKIIELNWRTKYCEIDIVAQKNQTVYLIEVKYRSSDRQGTGLDYITPTKLRQMKFAAEMWVGTHSWDGDYTLAVIGVGPDNFELIEDLI